MKIVIVLFVFLSLAVAGCLGFGEKEIPPNELPQNYSIKYEWDYVPNGDGGLFTLKNTGQIVVRNAMVKIENNEDRYCFNVFTLGDINPGEIKAEKIA